MTSLALSLQRQQELGPAATLYRTALRQAPDHDAARIGLAWIYFATDKTEKIPNLLNVNSDRFADLHLLGAWKLYNGDPNNGRALLRKARSLAAVRGAYPDAESVADIDCRLSENRAQGSCPFGPVMPTDGR